MGNRCRPDLDCPGDRRSFRGDRRSSRGDRRRTPRYPAGGAPALLGWSDERGFHTVTVWLRDISIGGALAVAGERPPKDLPVHFRLRDNPSDDWIEATVIRVSNTRFFYFSGPFLVSLSFSENCPYEAFKAVIAGTDAGSQDHA